MKKVLLIATIALTVLGCKSQREEQNPLNLTGELTIRIAGDDSKAVGTLPNEVAESTIGALDVLIFDNGGALVNTYAFSSDDLTAKQGKFTVKAGTVDIYVVANAVAGAFTGVTSKTEFYAVKATLSQTSTSLPMVCETLNHTLNVGENTLAAKVVRLGARVAINTITLDPKVAGATFTAQKVFMLNANTESTFGSTAADQISASKLGYGGKGATTPGGTLVADLGSAYTNISNKAYFYVFENKGTGAGNKVKPTTPTRLVIEGEWDADGSGGAFEAVKTFYIITVNEAIKSDDNQNSNTTAGTDGTFVKRNTQYGLNVTIKSQGEDDPTTEPTNTTLDVTVTVEPWKVITQTVSFE